MSAIKTLMAQLAERNLASVFESTGGGCYAVTMTLPDKSYCLVTDAEGPFSPSDHHSDDDVYGFTVCRYTADGEPWAEVFGGRNSVYDTGAGDPPGPAYVTAGQAEILREQGDMQDAIAVPLDAEVRAVVQAITRLADEITNGPDWVVAVRLLYTTPQGWDGSRDLPDMIVRGSQITATGAVKQITYALADVITAYRSLGYRNVQVQGYAVRGEWKSD